MSVASIRIQVQCQAHISTFLLVKVAGYLMVITHRLENRLHLRANRFSGEATRMKTAPRGWVLRSGHFPAKYYLLPYRIRVARESGGEESLGVGMQGVGKQFLAISNFHYLPQIHNCDVAAQITGGS